jgi:hypothetical protein
MLYRAKRNTQLICCILSMRRRCVTDANRQQISGRTEQPSGFRPGLIPHPAKIEIPLFSPTLSTSTRPRLYVSTDFRHCLRRACRFSQ